jgi:uncharacterized membrane protein YphA (DoxX/SURF4 family)
MATVTLSQPASLELVPARTARRVAYWLTTILGPTSFVIGGVLHLRGGEQIATNLTHLGYPLYFAYILGVCKLLGAIVITVPGLPRLKEWAYAGFFFNLTAAAASHAFSGDGAGKILPPLFFLALVIASWALRPESRKLASSASMASRVS